ncbi:glycosyltransferase family 4 protein [Frankia sp. CNm7]|uniref:Glycosyltransferase family 4 protein n=1 Tax=Frankia nepalensis TaxID=1836974 RepID=A0A937RHX0_9ACTN|nr:glycosyltransferase family 1 protein [Frankia nepalensis]MBL7496854.1 glycosyltransferase family 4 protein [Frankia nepalensis]MBL7514678.1 glycosyltransferase family 4 protein [Frankia nepalensis]MBL7524585.1 glycosyltransferase family 4 protein [Frankia nepalensis]MBL7630487.1 glycosyltransferase family 4 protein [Frankia nepalensis]
MRVGFLLDQVLAPVPGGTGRYSAELAAALARTAAPGDGVVGWCAWRPEHRPARARRLPAPVGEALAARLPGGRGPVTADAALPGVLGPLRLGLPRRALATAWARGAGPTPTGVDVVHAPTLLVPPRRRGVPLVVTIHDAVPWTHPRTLTPHGARWHQEMGARAARTADAIVVPTEAVAADLRPFLRVPDGRMHVIGEGAADAVLRVGPDADDRARRLGLPPDGYLLTLATLEPRKGLEVALAALGMVTGPAARLPLLHVGQPGWGALDAAAEAAKLGVAAGRFRSLGRIDDADLAVVLSRASVLVAPSRSEGFGLPVVEAMAHGVPVVVSDVPALVEVAGPAGTVVPVDDPTQLAAGVSRIVADHALRARLSDSGRARARHFSWVEAARECWELYRRVKGSPAVSVAGDGRA